MYCSQSTNGQGDFASITIKSGHVEFRFDTGSGPAILRSGVPVNVGSWYTVSVERKLRDGRLKVSTGNVKALNEDQEVTGISTVVTGKSPGSTRGLNIRTPLYFGGIDEDNRHVVAEGVGVKQGFAGCIADFKIGGIRRGNVGGGGMKITKSGRSGSTQRRNKVSQVNIEQSLVDSSNVFDCSSLQTTNVTVRNDAAPQPVKGISDCE